jgi:hypothetical protein
VTRARLGFLGLTGSTKAPSRSRSLQSVGSARVCPLVRSTRGPLQLVHARWRAEVVRFASQERFALLLAAVARQLTSLKSIIWRDFVAVLPSIADMRARRVIRIQIFCCNVSSEDFAWQTMCSDARPAATKKCARSPTTVGNCQRRQVRTQPKSSIVRSIPTQGSVA